MNVTTCFNYSATTQESAIDPQVALFQSEELTIITSTQRDIAGVLNPLLLRELTHLVCSYLFSPRFFGGLQTRSLRPHSYFSLADNQELHISRFTAEEALVARSFFWSEKQETGYSLIGVIQLQNLVFTRLKQPRRFDPRFVAYGKGRFYELQLARPLGVGHVGVFTFTAGQRTHLTTITQIPALATPDFVNNHRQCTLLGYDERYDELVIIAPDDLRVSAYQVDTNSQPTSFPSSFQWQGDNPVFFAQRVSPERFLLVHLTSFEVLDTQNQNTAVFQHAIESFPNSLFQPKYGRVHLSVDRDIFWAEIANIPGQFRFYSLSTGRLLKQVTYETAPAFFYPFQRGLCATVSSGDPIEFVDNEEEMTMRSTLVTDNKAHPHQLFSHQTGLAVYYRHLGGGTLLNFPFPDPTQVKPAKATSAGMPATPGMVEACFPDFSLPAIGSPLASLTEGSADMITTAAVTAATNQQGIFPPAFTGSSVMPLKEGSAGRAAVSADKYASFSLRTNATLVKRGLVGVTATANQYRHFSSPFTSSNAVLVKGERASMVARAAVPKPLTGFPVTLAKGGSAGSAAVAAPPATQAVVRSTAEELESQGYTKLNDDATRLLVELFHPTRGEKLEIYRDSDEWTSPLEIMMSLEIESQEIVDGNRRIRSEIERIHVETNRYDLRVPGKIVWSMLLDVKRDQQGAVHVKYPAMIQKWQWQERMRALVELNIPRDDRQFEYARVVAKFSDQYDAR